MKIRRGIRVEGSERGEGERGDDGNAVEGEVR